MEPDPALDRRLLDELQSDDPDRSRSALGALYDRYHRPLLNVAYRVVGDRQKAEDVIQEVFIALPRTSRSFRGDASLLAWLYRITTNKAIDFIRYGQRRPSVPLADQPGSDERVTPAGRREEDAPGEGLGQDERSLRIQRALMRLSPKLRAVAVLRHVQGLSYDDLAAVLELELGTVKSRLNRAHTALRQALKDEFGAEFQFPEKSSK